MSLEIDKINLVFDEMQDVDIDAQLKQHGDDFEKEIREEMAALDNMTQKDFEDDMEKESEADEYGYDEYESGEKRKKVKRYSDTQTGVSSALESYLQAIGQIKQYTEEELKIAMHKYNSVVEELDNAKREKDEITTEILNSKTVEEIQGYEKKIADLDKQIEKLNKRAINRRNDIVEHNLKLVVAVARRFAMGYSRDEFLDAIQIGNTGLIRAVQRYDYNKGFKFSTYAWWWIRQAITRYSDDNVNPLKMSSRMNTDIRKFRAIQPQLNEVDARINPKTVAEKLGWTEKHATEVMEAASVQSVSSLNAKIQNDDSSDSEMGDFVEDGKASFTDTVEDRLMASQFVEIILKLPDTAADILLRSFGLDKYAGNAQSDDEIGVVYGVPRDSIRRIREKAIRQLRDNPDYKITDSSVDKNLFF